MICVKIDFLAAAFITLVVAPLGFAFIDMIVLVVPAIAVVVLPQTVSRKD
jgi:hypothetical protein